MKNSETKPAGDVFYIVTGVNSTPTDTRTVDVAKFYTQEDADAHLSRYPGAKVEKRTE